MAGVGRGAVAVSTQAEWGKLRTASQKKNKQDEADDSEADDVYEEVERQLKAKKRKVKQDNLAQSFSEIAEGFKDAKKQLDDVSLLEWTNLPEPMDLTMSNKRLREERKSQMRFYRNSDALSLSMVQEGQTDEAISVDAAEGDESLVQNRAKDLVLDSKLTQQEEQGGKSGDRIDKHSYLKQLAAGNQAGENSDNDNRKVISNVGDYSKTKTLFNKMIQTQPHKPENWIAYARLEYDAKHYARAKDIIQTGCEKCPRNEEIWLVNLELNESSLSACKAIVADSIKYLNKSINLWSKAIDYESDPINKTRIIQKALEFLPLDESLWLKLIENEPLSEVKLKIVSKATEILPGSLSLWLLWSKLEQPQLALGVLDKARTSVANEDIPMLLLSKAKIQEKIDQNEFKIEKMIKECLSLSNWDYARWISEAKRMGDFKLVPKFIVLNVLELQEPSQEDILNDVVLYLSEGHYDICKFMLFYINNKYPEDLPSWLQSIDLAKKYPDHTDAYESVYIIYELALQSQPKCSQLYLMYAKDKWQLAGDIGKAREIIFEGMEQIPNDEDLWFAAVKLEHQSGHDDVALELFGQCKSRLSDPSARVWIKHVTLLRQLEDLEAALKACEDGLTKFEVDEKLYLQKGQILTEMERYERAKSIYELGTKKCPKSILIWIHLAELFQYKLLKPMRSRSVLDQAIGKNPHSDLLYYTKIKLEMETKQSSQLIERLVSKGLQICHNSGLLWSVKIELASEEEKRGVYAQALKSTKDDPCAILAIARDLAQRGEINKSQIFYESCLKKHPDFGDAYLYFYAYLLQHGQMDQMKQLESMFIQNDPRHGCRWPKITKKVQNIDKNPLLLLRKSAVETLSLNSEK